MKKNCKLSCNSSRKWRNWRKQR